MSGGVLISALLTRAVSVRIFKKPTGRFASGVSLDGKAEYTTEPARPMGGEPKLAPPMPEAYAETQQMRSGLSGMIENIKDSVAG